MRLIMNKRFIGLAVLSLTLMATTPAQAWQWSDLIPSWFKSSSTTTTQPINSETQAHASSQVIPAPVPARNWYAAIFNNPIASAYASFCAWWNKNRISNALPEHALKARAEEAERRAAIVSNARQNLYNRLQANKIALAFKTREKEDLLKQLTATIEELNALKSSDPGYKKRYELLVIREKALMEALTKVELKNLELESEKNSAELRLSKKEQEESATRSILAGQQNVIKDQANRIEHQEHVINTFAQMNVKATDELQTLKNKNTDAVASLNEFATTMNHRYDQFEQTAHTKLAKLAEKNEKNKKSLAAITQALNSPAKSVAQALPKLQLQENLLGSTTKNPMLSSWHSMENDRLLDALNLEGNKEFLRIANTVPMDPGFVDEQTKLGKEYYTKLLSNKDVESIPTGTQEEYLNSIIAINWFLYGIALEKTHGFDEGTYTVQDKGFRLRKFFMDYAVKFNPELKGDARDPLAHYSDNPFACSRDSSHFTEMKKIHRPYGIDIRYGPNGKEESKLPGNKRHLLFGVADEQNEIIYIKPENHGIYYKDGLPMHIGEFITAQARKRSYVRTLLSYVGINIGTDDAENSRKERVIEGLSSQVAQALQNNESISNDKKKLIVKEVSKKGFQALQNPELANEEQIKELLNTYREQYRLDHMEHRIGKEVVIRHDELAKRLQIMS